VVGQATTYHRFALSFLIVGYILVASSCSRATGATNTPADLTTRSGADPMNAVETYLRQYQPGPYPRLFQTTQFYDRNGVLLAELIDEGERTWVAIDQIARNLIDATVATEDATFFANSGVDPVRMVGAAMRNVQDGEITSGASTITMQLARNLFLGPEQRYDQSVDRKLLEIGLAQELTQLYSKAELLEMYLNLLNYGNLAYGPQAAAQHYFGKDAAAQTETEASLFARITQQPANLDPYRNFEATKRRQRIVLDLMVRHGYLTTADADEAFRIPLALRDYSSPDATALAPNRAPHFIQYVVETLDRRFGANYTRRSGLQITTSLDLTMQTLAQELVAEQVAKAEAQFDLSNAALVAMRPHSAEILVMVGSADFDDPAIAGQVNVAVSLRQPGSAIKPILYAAAFDRDLISPATVLWDTPITYPLAAGQLYIPENYDGQFHGAVTARTALANSYNIPTVKLLDALSVETMLADAQAMGLRSLNQPADWYGLSLTLGGGEVTLLDLTTAYHTLASAGAYLPPQAILATADALGRPLYPLEAIASRQVIDPSTAFLISDILSDNLARTPAFGTASPLLLSRPAAVKTGTTTDFRDNWTIGYTRYLITGVWAGNSDGHPMRNTSGITGAAPLWHDFMERVLADPTLLATLQIPDEETAWNFEPPANTRQLPDCPPAVYCRQGGEYFSESWLAATGAAGPLADSVEEVKTAPVYVQQEERGRLVGFCALREALEHTVLRMPDEVGIALLRPTTRMAETNSSLTTTSSGEDSEIGDNGVTDSATAAVYDGEIASSQLQTIGWALRNQSMLNLGACEHLPEILPQALAVQPSTDDSRLQVFVDLAAATDPTVAIVARNGPSNRDGIVPIDMLQQAINGEAGLIGGGYLVVTPVVHDNNCPGQYVMGRIVNSSGEPVAGVWVKMRDQWGNETTAVSKSGAIDYGMFDFPIPSGSPHELSLTVVGEDGVPLSATITIPHRQGEAAELSCHHIVFQQRN